MYTVGLYTLGCKVSQYETVAIGEELARRGFSVRDFSEICDAYVINTCTVTGESDRKSRNTVRRAIKKNKDAVIAVVGCYSQRAPEELLAIDGVNIVLGTDNKLSVADRVLSALQGAGRVKENGVLPLDNARFEPMCIESAPRTRAYVKIEDGCECKCTYCAISGARGRVRSKLPTDVIREVEGLYARGTREVVLTGIETGSYGNDFDFKYDLADLILELDKRHSCERIRLGSLAPELVGADFAKRVAGAKILAPHFHISMQSGSDNILRAMKRRYTRSRAMENINRLRELIPNAQFTTDLMVGFPGESEEDFLLTLDFIKEAKLLDAHIFAYSKREGTPAAEYRGQIPESIKRERSAQAILTAHSVRDSVLDGIVREGKILSAVLESEEGGVFTAHSDEYIEIRVFAPQSRQGDMVKVRPVSQKDGIVTAEIIS